MKNKKIWIAVCAVIVGVAVGAAAVAGYYKRHPVTVAVQEHASTERDPKRIDAPVSLGSPNVGLVFVHYFFSGSIKELKNVEGGTELILDSTNPEMPRIVLTPQIPISKVVVPPPAVPVPPKNLKIQDLKPGQNVDVSMEFDPVLKNWVVLGVFLPSNKNP